MLTIAYIGNEKITNRYHLPFVTKLQDRFKIKTIYSLSERPDWTPLENVNYTTELEDILEDEEVQLVVITTSVKSHYKFAKLVLNCNKNVLLEKAFTEKAEEARELFALARNRNLFIQCYQNRRFDSDFLTVRKVIESGKLGDLLEVEMHYENFRPEVPENTTYFSKEGSYLYGHGCQTIDQVISCFGKPDHSHYEVRQLLGKNRMNDYFDLDFYYGNLKVSIKSSYFRLKGRPSFTVYGKKGVFVKETIDRQEEHLKLFYMPENKDFGIDLPEHYGTLTYIDDEQVYHEEKVVSEVGDYSRVYQGVYDSIIHQKEKIITDEETILQIQILEDALKELY